MKIKFSKKIVLVLGIIICICMLGAGLVWWFLPYFYSIRGTDKETGFVYLIDRDTTILTKYVGDEVVVYVPERLKGRKTKVGWYCFESTNIEEVYVPNTVEVSSSAFTYCKNLRKFSGSSNKKIGEFTFYENEKLEEITFTNKIEEIERGAFWECTSLQSVDFIIDVKYLGSLAFAETSVRELPVMNSLEYVGRRVFKETPWEENQKENFVIIGDTLQLYKGSKEVVHIPEEVTTVRSAFVNLEENEYPIQVKEVYIPNTVKTLGVSVFLGQKDVTVYIPASVIEIGINDYGRVDEIGDNVKIITTAGSYAEEYAKEYGIEYEIVDGWD